MLVCLCVCLRTEVNELRPIHSKTHPWNCNLEMLWRLLDLAGPHQDHALWLHSVMMQLLHPT